MKAIQIRSLGAFTSHLLSKETFDSYYLVEASITTHSTFLINGTMHGEYYEEAPNVPYNFWKVLRPFVYEIMKGKRLPLQFKIILKANPKQVQDLVHPLSENLALPGNPEDAIDGLFLNIRYENGVLTLTTGTSMKIFTLDRTIEKAHDASVTSLLDSLEISYELL